MHAPVCRGLQEEAGAAAGGVREAEEDTGEPAHREVWGSLVAGDGSAEVGLP